MENQINSGISDLLSQDSFKYSDALGVFDYVREKLHCLIVGQKIFLHFFVDSNFFIISVGCACVSLPYDVIKYILSIGVPFELSSDRFTIRLKCR